MSGFTLLRTSQISFCLRSLHKPAKFQVVIFSFLANLTLWPSQASCLTTYTLVLIYKARKPITTSNMFTCTPAGSHAFWLSSSTHLHPIFLKHADILPTRSLLPLLSLGNKSKWSPSQATLLLAKPAKQALPGFLV